MFRVHFYLQIQGIQFKHCSDLPFSLPPVPSLVQLCYLSKYFIHSFLFVLHFRTSCPHHSLFLSSPPFSLLSFSFPFFFFFLTSFPFPFPFFPPSLYSSSFLSFPLPLLPFLLPCMYKTVTWFQKSEWFIKLNSQKLHPSLPPNSFCPFYPIPPFLL